MYSYLYEIIAFAENSPYKEGNNILMWMFQKINISSVEEYHLLGYNAM
jgi:hypothetical protein